MRMTMLIIHIFVTNSTEESQWIDTLRSTQNHTPTDTKVGYNKIKWRD